MQVQIVYEDDKAFTLEVVGEDYALAEIIHHELLNEKNITFAGVLQSHPLIKRLVVKVKAQRIKPEKALLTSIENSKIATNELLKVVTQALSGGME
jgi:DNA-directed RNA polymerase subunit L